MGYVYSDWGVHFYAVKVSYVLDTEDILFRMARKKGDSDSKKRKGGGDILSDSPNSRRVRKFHRWIDGQYYQKKDR